MLRFTIRELVLLTLVVAMGVGWWLDHRRRRDENETLLLHIVGSLPREKSIDLRALQARQRVSPDEN